jgi:hypothetical protein
MTMIALNPQPLPPHSDEALTTAVVSLKPTLLRPGVGGCPTCTSGRFLLWQTAVDGETAIPLQVVLPNVEVG